MVCSQGRNVVRVWDAERDSVYDFPELEGLDVQSVVEDADGRGGSEERESS